MKGVQREHGRKKNNSSTLVLNAVVCRSIDVRVFKGGFAVAG